MPLLPTRPSLRLRTPRFVVPGESFEIAAILDARVEVEIDWCDITLSGYEAYTERRTPVIQTLAARLCGVRTLGLGTTTLACRVTLPADAPRSHPGPGSRIIYEVNVHASVPWWPDARASFALHVVGRPAPPVTGRPRVAVSRIEGPQAGTPYVELSVGSDASEPGGIVDGSVALRDVGGAKTRVSLVAYERDVASGNAARVGAWAIPVDARAEGEAMAFAFRVPDDVTPTMSAGSFSLEYWLTASAHVRLGELVSASVPIRIADRGGVVSTDRVVAPHVGDARLEELFTEVGAAEGATVEPGPTLVARVEGVSAHVSRELARSGTRLAVRITYPPLHLDLSVREPALPALSRGRRAARRAGLSPRCVVAARDEAQASSLLERVSSHLARAQSIDMSDTELRYAIPTAANDRTGISRVVREMRTLASALAAPPPMPSAMTETASAWTQLAIELGGALEPGHARVVAETADASVEVATLFGSDGAPFGTVVSTRPARELLVDATITLDEPSIPLPPRLSPEARAAMERIARFGRVRIDAQEIRVTLDVPLGHALPVLRGREIIDASLRLAAALRPSAGPFR